jgi:hypothetical protein
MMLYAIIARDVEESLALRQAVRPAHLARLQALQDDGRLVTAGAFPAVDSNEHGSAGFTGSAIIAEFDSLEQAQAWADGDPYRAGGVYAEVTVTPYRQAFPR